MAESYNPQSDMRMVSGAPYLPVAARVQWLRDREPAATITTQALEITSDRAVFRAEIALPDGRGSSTGHGSETKGDFLDFIEKAETKAIGRALALLGFGTQFVGDELSDGPRERPVDAPRGGGNVNHLIPQRPAASTYQNTQPQAGSGGGGGGRPATDKQKGYLLSLIQGLHVTDPGAWIVDQTGGTSLADLSSPQASNLIEGIKGGAFAPGK